jgi:hypothetical protein
MLSGDEDHKEQQVRTRVSSKHLTLASRVFKSMLQPGFVEGNQLRSQSLAEFSLPDDNPAATLILLNLIHGKNRKVPSEISLKMLVEIAILVDKYELLETTDLILDQWLENLGDSIHRDYRGDILSWLCVSCVFRRRYIFEHVTYLAQLECAGPIEMCGLPIPGSVLSKE